MLSIIFLCISTFAAIELVSCVQVMQDFSIRTFEGASSNLSNLSATSVAISAMENRAHALDDSSRLVVLNRSIAIQESIRKRLDADGLTDYTNLESMLLRANSGSIGHRGNAVPKVRELTKLRNSKLSDFDNFVIQEQKLIAENLNELSPHLRDLVKQAMEQIKYGRVGYVNYLMLATQEGNMTVSPMVINVVRREFQKELDSSQVVLEEMLVKYYANVLAGLPVHVQKQFAGQIGFSLLEFPKWISAHRDSKWQITEACGMPLYQYGNGFDPKSFTWEEKASDSQLVKSVLLRFGRIDEMRIPLLMRMSSSFHDRYISAEMLGTAIRKIDRFLVLVSAPDYEKTASAKQIETVTFYRDLLAAWSVGPVDLTLADWDYILASETASEPVRLHLGSLANPETRQLPHIGEPLYFGAPQLRFLNGRMGNPVSQLKVGGLLSRFTDLSVEQVQAINGLESQYPAMSIAEQEIDFDRQREVFSKLDQILTPAQSVAVFRSLLLRIGVGTYFMHPGVAAEYGMTPNERETFHSSLMTAVEELLQAEQAEIARVLKRVFERLPAENIKELERNLGLSLEELIAVHQRLLWAPMARNTRSITSYYYLFDEPYLPNVTKFSDKKF